MQHTTNAYHHTRKSSLSIAVNESKVSRAYLLAVRQYIVVDGQQADLLRRKPQREVASVVLDQDAEKALHRPKNGAMDHDWSLLAAILGLILQPETLGEIEVALDRLHARQQVAVRVADTYWIIIRSCSHSSLKWHSGPKLSGRSTWHWIISRQGRRHMSSVGNENSLQTKNAAAVAMSSYDVRKERNAPQTLDLSLLGVQSCFIKR